MCIWWYDMDGKLILSEISNKRAREREAHHRHTSRPNGRECWKIEKQKKTTRQNGAAAKRRDIKNVKTYITKKKPCFTILLMFHFFSLSPLSALPSSYASHFSPSSIYVHRPAVVTMRCRASRKRRRIHKSSEPSSPRFVNLNEAEKTRSRETFTITRRSNILEILAASSRKPTKIKRDRIITAVSTQHSRLIE